MLVNVTLPVFNEIRELEKNVLRVVKVFKETFNSLEFEIVIADNGSSDGTTEVARRLSGDAQFIRYLRLDTPGRGRAIKHAWLKSKADVVSYMDIDLSTDLACYHPLLQTIEAKECDLAIGSRLIAGSKVTRRFLREFLSRAYNILIKAVFRTPFNDAQCGFKAMSRSAAQQVLPYVTDAGWFMDTELLVLTDHFGYKIREVPVTWIDDSDSRVKLVETIVDNLKGVVKLRRRINKGLR